MLQERGNCYKIIQFWFREWQQWKSNEVKRGPYSNPKRLAPLDNEQEMDWWCSYMLSSHEKVTIFFQVILMGWKLATQGDMRNLQKNLSLTCLPNCLYPSLPFATLFPMNFGSKSFKDLFLSFQELKLFWQWSQKYHLIIRCMYTWPTSSNISPHYLPSRLSWHASWIQYSLI